MLARAGGLARQPERSPQYLRHLQKNDKSRESEPQSRICLHNSSFGAFSWSEKKEKGSKKGTPVFGRTCTTFHEIGGAYETPDIHHGTGVGCRPPHIPSVRHGSAMSSVEAKEEGREAMERRIQPAHQTRSSAADTRRHRIAGCGG